MEPMHMQKLPFPNRWSKSSNIYFLVNQYCLKISFAIEQFALTQSRQGLQLMRKETIMHAGKAQNSTFKTTPVHSN